MSWDLIDNLWRDPWDGRTTLRSRPQPAVNVYGDDNEVVVTSEVPGLEVKDLDINVHGRNLSLRGKRSGPVLVEGERLTTGDRPRGEFTRSVTLPYNVEADKVTARYENGVLILTLPRAERDKPRKIEVKAA